MKFIQHPMAIYAAKLLVYAALSAGIYILMAKFYKQPTEPKEAVVDSTRIQNLELNLLINDSNLQQIKSNVDSILLQTQTNEASLQRIRASRTSANSHISSMSSTDLTRSLAKRYTDSL